MKSNENTLGSRFVVGLFNGAAGFIFIGLLQFFLALKGGSKGGAETANFFLNSSFLWLGTLAFFLIGFLLGSKKAAHVWGKIFGTNKE